MIPSEYLNSFAIKNTEITIKDLNSTMTRIGVGILDKRKGMIYVARYSWVLPDNSQSTDGLFRVGRGLENMKV